MAQAKNNIEDEDENEDGGGQETGRAQRKTDGGNLLSIPSFSSVIPLAVGLYSRHLKPIHLIRVHARNFQGAVFCW